MTLERKKSLGILIGLLTFFLGIYAAYGVGVYNDSDQYIIMHIHREPLYPLFLAFFRVVAGESKGLAMAAVAQNLLTAFSIFFLIEYLRKRFSLNLFGELTLLLLELMPHLVTRYISSYHIFMENSIMSEALCIPLFQFFTLFTLRMLFEEKKTDMVWSLLFAWLLSMTRGQMMATILIWLVIVCFRLIGRKQYKRLLLPVLAVICAFGIRTLAVHTYNYFVTGYFTGNTYGPVNMLANVIYACDREDGEVFEEGSLERTLFERFYDNAEAMEAIYRYADESPRGRIMHLEDHHDMIKFYILEANMTEYWYDIGIKDYYQQNFRSDEAAANMLRKLLPQCFGQWLYDYLLLCWYGFIRSIAVVHRWINCAALILYLTAAGLSAWMLRKYKKCDAAFMMAFALLFIAANVCATSLTIMCLSRYMIYGFSLFYMSLFLLIIELMRKARKGDRI